ncbi:MAG: hypothetical protein CME19_14460 [Gemmatimonadetes bacterium]|nr:hypothetical protein [Gemmatimonadota bacterium]
MGNTTISIENESFLINDKLTYSDLDGSNPNAHGLLMNARFIQGIFDDKADPGRFARWGNDIWDPKAHTQGLIDALPEWYGYGLRAFTTGFQGGGPCFTINNGTIDNNPFSEDGKSLDPAYAERIDSLIWGADALGMAVIVSYFYGAQALRLPDGRSIRNAVTTASRFLKDGGYSNVLIEIANEMNIGEFRHHPIIQEPEGMATLINLARDESGGMAAGCSGGGGYRKREVAEASDYILVHGNGQSRQRYYNMILEVKSWDQNKPIVCNEDSPAIGNMGVAYKTATSWGYYNNMTKQEPPADWSVTKGEDTFFAYRMAMGIGIDVPDIPEEDQYYLQGLEPEWSYDGQRWIRMASLYPESISYVDFYRDGELFHTSYDESFAINFQSNWRYGGVDIGDDRAEWKAVVHLGDGRALEKTAC